MKKVFSYLRFYWLEVCAIIALVFTQTMWELELPDYMSKIINTGIMLATYAHLQKWLPQFLWQMSRIKRVKNVCAASLQTF